MRRSVLLAAAIALGACAAAPGAGGEVAALLLGEQHDAPRHQQLHLDVIEQLAGRSRLAAVVLEMAEHGGTTERLAADATEEQVRSALGWKPAGWSWAAYGPAVMAAVRAGAPVRGANLPADAMKRAMRDETLDRALPASALLLQQRFIRDGHCGLLPEAQIAPMTRVQIARDRSMAQAIAAAAVPGKTVVLLAGAGHVDPDVGVPRHLPAGFRAKPVLLPPEPTGKDDCGELRMRMPPARGAS